MKITFKQKKVGDASETCFELEFQFLSLFCLASFVA